MSVMQECRARRAGVWLATAVFAVGLAATPVWAFRNLKEGEAAPDFTLKSTKGEDVSLGASKGKAVVVVFVDQTKDKSEKALKALAQLDAALTAKADVLAVVVDTADGDAAAWGQKLGVSFPVLLDSSKDVYGKYGVFVTPATGVVKPDGAFAGEVSGYSAGYKEEVEGLLKIALGMTTAEELKATAEKAKGPELSAERKKAEREVEEAKTLLKRKMKDKALEAAKLAAATDATYAPAHALLGRLLLEVSDANADEALGHFDKALALSPKDVEAKIGKAKVMALKGDADGAVALLEDAAKLNPKPERVYYHLGLVLEKAGKFDKAVEAYRKALEKILNE